MPAVRALFVDDEPAILSLFRIILEMQGYEVQCAASAWAACELLAEQHFDLFITDMHMERSDAGCDVIAAALRLRPRPAIAILTAYILPEEEWRQTGADDLFIKGTEVPTITRRLRALLDARPGRWNAANPVPNPFPLR